MTEPESGPQPGSAGTTTVTLVVVVLQALCTLFTFFMGMAWGGPTYNAALLQSVLGIAAIVFVAGRWPRRMWLMLLLPPVSLAITFALEHWGSSLGHTGA